MPDATPQLSPTSAVLTPARLAALFQAVAERVQSAAVFAPPAVTASRLTCPARDSAQPAEYRLFLDAGKLWVALVTADRWLSQSIEADLVHTGDKLEELVEEELIDKGWEGVRLPVEHFRDDDKLYTFRSPLPLDPAGADDPALADRAAQTLLAYEATFRVLGDMEAGEEE